jgi:hypothetical protein
MVFAQRVGILSELVIRWIRLREFQQKIPLGIDSC